MNAFIDLIKKHALIAWVTLAVVVAVAGAAASSVVQRSAGTSASDSKALTANGGSYVGSGEMALPPSVGAPSAMPIVPPMPQPSAGPTAASVDQKIIKNGSLQMVVDDVASTVTRVTGTAAAHKGFVQNSSVSERADGTHAGDITVRVPASDFDAVMTEIKGFANVVKNETATGQDVTEQYTDLQARLHNAQAQEQVYLEILKQARTVEDTLKVQQQLGAIRGEIESYQGQIQYLENVTSYSTIAVSIEEEPTVRAPTKEFRPLTIAREAVQTLIGAFQGIAASLITFIIVGGGILLPLALLLWIIIKLWKRRS